jgi:hypothetical protein
VREGSPPAHIHPLTWFTLMLRGRATLCCVMLCYAEPLIPSCWQVRQQVLFILYTLMMLCRAVLLLCCAVLCCAMLRRASGHVLLASTATSAIHPLHPDDAVPCCAAVVLCCAVLCYAELLVTSCWQVWQQVLLAGEGGGCLNHERSKCGTSRV